ncbi:MAG: acyl-CoA dehydrogenase family protein [Gemmatimonadaceae bacterium]
MPDRTFLGWPFFEDSHRALAADLETWVAREIPGTAGENTDADAACTSYVKLLAAGGWLRYVVPGQYGGGFAGLDVRSICLVRETLARTSGLADFAFAMQGLGSAPVSIFGSEALKRRYLPNVCAGRSIAAFALSEPESGSDVAGMRTTARRDRDAYVIDGTKTFISNAGIADHYVVFARLESQESGGGGGGGGGAGASRKSFVALMVDAENPGLEVTERIDVIAPHPLGTLTLTDCRVGADAVIGEPGGGLKVALGTLDSFRPTVAAAALGFARRALDEAVSRVKERKAFDRQISEFQLTQARLADMAVAVDASALLVYRAAWAHDTADGDRRITREAAIAKLYATEAAQVVIDSAVQLFGGRGIVRGEIVEALYREIRALRIYEGTSEIQKLVIAGRLLAEV